MNYSRVGGPTPVNKPGVDKRIDDKMDILLEQQQIISEAIGHYRKKIQLNDFWKDWYLNALHNYEKKLDKVVHEIKNTSGYKEPKDELAKGTEAEKEGAGTGSGPTPAKEEGTKSKKS